MPVNAVQLVSTSRLYNSLEYELLHNYILPCACKIQLFKKCEQMIFEVEALVFEAELWYQKL